MKSTKNKKININFYNFSFSLFDSECKVNGGNRWPLLVVNFFDRHAFCDYFRRPYVYILESFL
jgi:hypothetical protein